MQSKLADLHLPAIRSFDRLDSTNAEAWRWVDLGAPHQALVIADEQTAGRGRAGRKWITPHGAGLAFSLILHSPPFPAQALSRLSGLGAVAIRRALLQEYGLSAQIKWPNDVLIGQRKVAGVLVETRWSGQALSAVLIGLGINIAPLSVSAENLPPSELNFPATCVENACGHPIDRLQLLHAVLHQFLEIWLPQLAGSDFMREWEGSLAFREQWVEISTENDPANRILGKVVGLAQDGSLRLATEDSRQISISAGEVHLRPVSDLFQPRD